MKSVFLTLIIVCIYIISTQAGYGQRVYANTQQYANSALANVNSPGNAVDSDYTNATTLNVTVGLLSLIYAQQNLQFTGGILPAATSPIIIKFSTNDALLGLANNMEVQRTLGGMDNLVAPVYASSSLVALLNLNADSTAEEVTIPIPPGLGESDGVRLRIKTQLLGLAFSADLYYAFFITPPSIEPSTVSVCEGESALVGISNFQVGYTYRIYDALTQGNLLYSGTEDVLSLPASGLAAGTYYLEAVEGETEFTSSRIPFDLVIYPKPGYPDIDLNVNQN